MSTVVTCRFCGPDLHHDTGDRCKSAHNNVMVHGSWLDGGSELSQAHPRLHPKQREHVISVSEFGISVNQIDDIQ